MIKKQRENFLSCVMILLSVSFFLGELVGLYAISHTKTDLNTVIGSIHFDQLPVETLKKILRFYLPCLPLLIHYRWFIVIPVVLFCRGYFFGCSLAAISYLNTDDTFNLLAMILSVGLHTMSLTVLSSSVLYCQLVKRKYIFGNIAAERQNSFKSIIFAMFSIVICCILELFFYP